MTKNKVWKIVISVAIAFSFWLYVVSVVSPGSEKTFYDIEVKIMDSSALKAENMILTDYNKTVTVRLEGNRSDLNLLNKSNLTAYAYVAGSTPEDTHIEYSINLPDSVAGNAIVVQKKSPEKLEIKIEKLEKKTVPVVLRVAGEPQEGYMINADLENGTDELLDYSQVDVQGPESLVKQMEYAVIDLDITGRTKSVEEAYEYVFCDAQMQRVDGDPELIDALTTDKINVNIPILMCKELPLVVKRIPGGGATEANCQVQISPVKTLLVAGPEEILKDMDALVIDTVELKDLQQNEERTISLNAYFEKNGLLNLSETKEVVVQLMLKDLETKTVTVDLQVQNPDNVHYETGTKEITVRFRGPASLIKELNPKDVKVTINLSGSTVGVQALKPTVTLPDKFKDVAVVSQDPETIYVTVNN